jgi:hypothetical protein
METTRWKRLVPFLGVAGLILVGIVSWAPLLFERLPVDFAPPPSWSLEGRAGKALVIVVFGVIIGLRAWLDYKEDAESGVAATGALLLLATILTACHWYLVDDSWKLVVKDGTITKDYYIRRWQEYQYFAHFNHILVSRKGALSTIPHVYRPLPYGFTRSLELMTGSWEFACLAYRWFFTFWFVWAYYRCVRLFHNPSRSLLSVCVLLVLYPISIWYYYGQLTDPMSHALYALGLIYVVQNRWLALALALAWGIQAKETAATLVLAYYLCYWRQGVAALLRTGVLALVCVAAFLATRVPLGWKFGFDSVNATTGWMIGSNLGIGSRVFREGLAPTYQNYLQPLLFVGAFVPFILARWRGTDPRLKVLFLTQVPLVLLSSLCFSWMYESRNYVPLLPLLTTMAQSGKKEPAHAPQRRRAHARV